VNVSKSTYLVSQSSQSVSIQIRFQQLHLTVGHIGECWCQMWSENWWGKILVTVSY